MVKTTASFKLAGTAGRSASNAVNMDDNYMEKSLWNLMGKGSRFVLRFQVLN